MDNTDKKISFIKSFSDKEWILNGWINEDPKLILEMFQTLASFVKDGNYLELGCGSGILSRFLYLFSGKKIIPYGVDINQEAVRLAKKNNFEFADNFKRRNYFETLESNTFDLKKFSTVSIFVGLGKQNWKILRKVLTPVIKKCKKTNFIIIAYDYDFFDLKDNEIIEFVSVMNKTFFVSVAGHSTLIIGKDKKIHAIAEKYRKNILEHNKHIKHECVAKKTILGTIVKKDSSSFSLVCRDSLKGKKTGEIKFSLTSKQSFSEYNYSVSTKIISEKIISWEKIKNGDFAEIIFGEDKRKKVLYSVRKIIGSS